MDGAARNIPVSWVAFRLQGGYFAIGTWVIAEVFRPSFANGSFVGGDSETGLTALRGIGEHLTKAGESKLVERCSYPLTGLGCVCRVCADLAVIDLRPQGPAVVQMCEGMVRSRLQALTSVALHAA